MRRWRAGRVRPAGIQSRWRSSSLSRRRMLGRRSLLSRSGMCGRLRGGCEGARGHYRASAVSPVGAAPPHPHPGRARCAALAHPPTLGFSFLCGGFAPTPPPGSPARMSRWSRRPAPSPRWERVGVRGAPSPAGAAPPRPHPDGAPSLRPPRPLRERVGVRGSDARGGLAEGGGEPIDGGGGGDPMSERPGSRALGTSQP